MDANPGKAIGAKLRELREARGESINDFVIRSGLGRGSIWTLENGSVRNPGIATVVAISKCYGVNVDSLLGGEADIPNSVFGHDFAGLSDVDRQAVLALCQHLSSKTAAISHA